MSVRKEDEHLSLIYKYRSLIGKNEIYTGLSSVNKNTMNLIINGDMFFSKPETFNDPFDSKETFDHSATLTEVANYYRNIGHLPEDKIQYLIHQIQNGVITLASLSPENDPSFTSPLRIYCFSKEPNNILLWSHYSMEHTGICLGFRVLHQFNSIGIKVQKGGVIPIDLGDDGTFLPLVPIEYKLDRPKPYNIFRGGNHEDLAKFFITKSIVWEYEKEYRIPLWVSKMNTNPISIEKGELKEIIFGIRTEKKLIKEIVTEILNNTSFGKDIKYKKCIPSRLRYEIEIEDI